MGVSAEFESLEFQFSELIAEFRSVTSSESRLREAVRTEATRAETAEAALAAAERAAAEAHNSAAAATAGATRAAAELAAACEQLTGLKMQLEIAERQRTTLDEKCTEMTAQINTLERELQQLRPLQSAQVSLQRQYTELQERIAATAEDARREASRLESELRRVERCAAGGSEIRERARLAAAAHARERRLAATELQHTIRELQAANASRFASCPGAHARERRLAAAELQHTIRESEAANVEISKLSSQVAELQLRLAHESSSKRQHLTDPDVESLAEVRSALEAERAGTEKLEKALAAALADNATLAAQIHAKQTTSTSQAQPAATPCSPATTNICPIDSFLAD